MQDPDDSQETWRNLPPPPEEVKEIIGAEDWTVYVVTQKGKILSCYRESRLDTQCWTEVDQVPNMMIQDADGICDNCYFPEPPENIKVIQAYQIDYPDSRDTSSVFSYMLDGDGQVWQWNFARFLYFGSPSVLRISRIASLVGLSTGSTLPLLLWILLWRKELLIPFRKKQ